MIEDLWGFGRSLTSQKCCSLASCGHSRIVGKISVAFG